MAAPVAGVRDWPSVAPARLAELQSLFEALVGQAGRETADLASQVDRLREELATVQQEAAARLAAQALEAAERATVQATAAASRARTAELAQLRDDHEQLVRRLERTHAAQKEALQRELEAVRLAAEEEREAVAANAQRQVAALSRERDACLAEVASVRADAEALETRLARQTSDAAQAVAEALSALQREREASAELRKELDAVRAATGEAGADSTERAAWEEERARLQAALADSEARMATERNHFSAQLAESEAWMRNAMEAQRTGVVAELATAKEAARTATADAETAREALGAVIAERDALQARLDDAGHGNRREGEAPDSDDVHVRAEAYEQVAGRLAVAVGRLPQVLEAPHRAYEQAKCLIADLQAQLEGAVLAGEAAERRAAAAAPRRGPCPGPGARPPTWCARAAARCPGSCAS